MAHHLLLYEYVVDMAKRRTAHREAHLAHVGEQRQAGHITMAGAFDPPLGAALIFADVERADVEAFVAADPYQAAGLITSWRIERWNLV
ncbi:MAG TPA: YciI family protein [Solirubrobacteraceae bacterium]|jgi:uncharacterized protein YciI